MNSVGKDNNLQNCKFGRGSYTGTGCILNSAKIGRFCSLGSYIHNTSGRHPSTVFVTTHPAFFSKSKAAGFTFSTSQKFEELKCSDEGFLLEIGNDVWIGDNVVIQDGIKIGNGAIIGTGAIVTKDIEPFTINVGIPAKAVKKRFSDEQITFLQSFKWWDKDLKWIKQNAELFENIDLLMKEYNED